VQSPIHLSSSIATTTSQLQQSGLLIAPKSYTSPFIPVESTPTRMSTAKPFSKMQTRKSLDDLFLQELANDLHRLPPEILPNDCYIHLREGEAEVVGGWTMERSPGDMWLQDACGCLIGQVESAHRPSTSTMTRRLFSTLLLDLRPYTMTIVVPLVMI